MANRGESFPQRKDTSSSPSPPWAFLMSDVSSTPVININLGGWGQHLPAPHRLCSAGLSAALPGKAGGESLSWQLVSQGWGRLCYTTLTFGVESSAKSKPTRIHQQLGTAAALVLCSPPLPSQSREDAGKFMKLHSAWCSADYPQHQTRLCFGQPVLVGFKARGERKIRNITTPGTQAQREDAGLWNPSHLKQGTSCARTVSPPETPKQLHFAASGADPWMLQPFLFFMAAPAHPQPSLLDQDDRSK